MNRIKTIGREDQTQLIGGSEQRIFFAAPYVLCRGQKHCEGGATCHGGDAIRIDFLQGAKQKELSEGKPD
jgi:hypothetical protein